MATTDLKLRVRGKQPDPAFVDLAQQARALKPGEHFTFLKRDPEMRPGKAAELAYRAQKRVIAALRRYLGAAAASYSVVRTVDEDVAVVCKDPANPLQYRAEPLAEAPKKAARRR